MFHFAKVTDFLRFKSSAVKELENLLLSSDIFTLHFWYSPGHIFCSLKNGLELKSFDAQPKLEGNFKEDVSIKNLLLKNMATPICNIFFNTQKYDPIKQFIHIVCRNGKVHCYYFDNKLLSWTRHLELNLWNVPFSNVGSIIYHENQGIFYWCEKNIAFDTSPTSYNLIKRPFDNVSASSLLITNCPNLEFYPIGDVLFMWPGNELPSNVFLIWKISANQIQVHILNESIHVSFDKQLAPFDFGTLMTSTITLWTKLKIKNTFIAKVINPCLNQLVLLSTDGKVFYISTEGLQTESKFTLENTFFTLDTHFTVYRNMLLVFRGHTKPMEIINLENGKLMQKIDIGHQGDNPHIWIHYGLIQSVGIFNCQGIYQLRMSISEECSNNIGNIPLQILKNLQQTQLISLKKLEEIWHKLEHNCDTIQSLSAVKSLLEELQVALIEGKGLLPTKLGKSLIELLPKYLRLEQDMTSYY